MTPSPRSVIVFQRTELIGLVKDVPRESASLLSAQPEVGPPDKAGVAQHGAARDVDAAKPAVHEPTT
jgi:hypothetical protein